MDVKAMAEDAAKAIKGYFARAIAGVNGRVDELEQRMQVMQRRLDELEEHATRPDGGS